MITHFDMVSGQVVGDENHDTPAVPNPGVGSLRLLTVQEAAAIAPRPAAPVPADIALLPVSHLLAKWE